MQAFKVLVSLVLAVGLILALVKIASTYPEDFGLACMAIAFVGGVCFLAAWIYSLLFVRKS